jgi:hypothetical protein
MPLNIQQAHRNGAIVLHKLSALEQAAGTASLILDTASEQQAEAEKRITLGSAVTTFSNAHGGTEPLNRC